MKTYGDPRLRAAAGAFSFAIARKRPLLHHEARHEACELKTSFKAKSEDGDWPQNGQST